MDNCLNIKVGTAPDSWGVWFPVDQRKIPWNQYLDEVVAAGYQWTELGPYGYLPKNIKHLERELKGRGLQVCAAFAMGHLEVPKEWPSLRGQIIGACESVAALGGKFIVLIDDTYTDLFNGNVMRPSRLNRAEWQRLIENVHAAADIVLDKYKLTLVFHPHVETHVEYEEQIELFLQETDPNRVKLCLDTGHHAYRGGDPVRFLRKHHRRIPYLHLKNVDSALRNQVLTEHIPFARAVEMGMFCEPARGVVSFEQLREVMREIGFQGSVTVEEDMYPTEFDKPLPIARRTRQYLQTVGIG